MSWKQNGFMHGREYWPARPVDTLTEQIGVPVMAHVLLAHVHEQLAQGNRLALGVAAREAEIVVAGELLSEGNLPALRRPGLLDYGRVSDRAVEVGVRVGVGPIAGCSRSR